MDNYEYFTFQYSCLLNPVDPRIVTLVRRSLEKGITRRSDLNGVIALHNEDNFPEVKITDAAFYPSMSTLSSIMYRQLLHLRYSHMDEERILEIVSMNRFNFSKRYVINCSLTWLQIYPYSSFHSDTRLHKRKPE